MFDVLRLNGSPVTTQSGTSKVAYVLGENTVRAARSTKASLVCSAADRAVLVGFLGKYPFSLCIRTV